MAIETRNIEDETEISTGLKIYSSVTLDPFLCQSFSEQPRVKVISKSASVRALLSLYISPAPTRAFANALFGPRSCPPFSYPLECKNIRTADRNPNCIPRILILTRRSSLIQCVFPVGKKERMILTVDMFHDIAILRCWRNILRVIGHEICIRLCETRMFFLPRRNLWFKKLC